MNRTRHRLEIDRLQALAWGLLSFTVVGLAAGAAVTTPESFRPYFGVVPTLLVVVVAAGLGAVLWSVLIPRGWVVYEPGAARRSLPLVVVLPTLLAAGMVLVDLAVVLPPDFNVPYPESLLFYPTIGFVVEVVFHLLPLSVLLLAIASWIENPDRPGVVWSVIVVVALIEPIFQVALGFSRPVPRWASAYVAANVFAINLAQLYCFRRYDFRTTYAFRLVYYLLWHVVWGHVRLQVLF